MSRNYTLLSLTTLALCLGVSSAQAHDRDRDPGAWPPRGGYNRPWAANDAPPAFLPQDRMVITRYYGPPVPRYPRHFRIGRGPVRATNFYVIGQPLPRHIRCAPLPLGLRQYLRPAPRGYEYVQVDRDILLISQATRHVIDAVVLASAIGNR